MTYIVLQLAHLREDRALLVKRQRELDKLSSREKLQPQERAELVRRWDAWYNELAVNLSFLPITIHGSAPPPPFPSHAPLNEKHKSLQKGLFGNDVSRSFRSEHRWLADKCSFVRFGVRCSVWQL